MRTVVYKVYRKYLPPSANILELNAGTGVDALWLASQNHKVFATDISDEMVNIIRRKAEAGRLDIKTSVYSFDEISKVEEGDFDAVVSNFGGLNCINDFSKLCCDLAAKLKDDGLFIAVVMNKYCPWEMLYYMLRFDFKNAFRRLKSNGIMAALNGEKVLTYYYSPGEFADFFDAHFRREHIYTLALYTPAPYMIGICNKLKPLVKLWMMFDELIKGIFPFNRFGDHFIVVLRKIKKPPLD